MHVYKDFVDKYFVNVMLILRGRNQVLSG